jgi:acyl carrier protein
MSMSAPQIIERLKPLLRDTLQLGRRADSLTASSRLLGTIPEFDSMAVVSVITLIEEQFDISVADDEVSADVFESMGTLAEFIRTKVQG